MPWIAEAGIYQMGARNYAPGIGRWMQTDPILTAGGINLYAYVGNDPVNLFDLSGLDEIEGGQRVCDPSCHWVPEPDIVVTSPHHHRPDQPGQDYNGGTGGHPEPGTNPRNDPNPGDGGDPAPQGLQLPFVLCSVVEGQVSSGIQVGVKGSFAGISLGGLASLWSAAATGGFYNGGDFQGQVVQRVGFYGSAQIGLLGGSGRIGMERSTEGGIRSIPQLFGQPVATSTEPPFIGIGGGAAMGFGAEGRIGFFVRPPGSQCPNDHVG